MASKRPSWKIGDVSLHFSPDQIERQRQFRKERCTPPSDDLAITRIMRVFSQATDEEIEAGKRWYQSAHEICVSLAEEHSTIVPSAQHVAGIIAALSPRLSWNDNIRRAKQLLETGETGGVQNWVMVAKQIRDGDDPFILLFDPQRQNWKVRSFLMNISFPEWMTETLVPIPEAAKDEPAFVTIDRHAWGVLYDDRTIGDVLLRPTKKLYDWGRDVFIAAADEIDDIFPHELQAVTWLVWRTRRSLDDSHVQGVLF